LNPHLWILEADLKDAYFHVQVLPRHTRFLRFAFQVVEYNSTWSITSNSVIKFAYDTTVIGLITNNDKTAYREEVRALGVW
jgi:hypothetical protein